MKVDVEIDLRLKSWAVLEAVVKVDLSPADGAEVLEGGLLVKGAPASVCFLGARRRGAVVVESVSCEAYTWTRWQRPDWFALADAWCAEAVAARFEDYSSEVIDVIAGHRQVAKLDMVFG